MARRQRTLLWIRERNLYIILTFSQAIPGITISINYSYCNSVLQALYFCKPFRDYVLNYPDSSPPPETSNSTTSAPATPSNSKKEPIIVESDDKVLDDSLFRALRELFWKIQTQKKKSGSIMPKGFIDKLRKENGTH